MHCLPCLVGNIFSDACPRLAVECRIRFFSELPIRVELDLGARGVLDVRHGLENVLVVKQFHADPWLCRGQKHVLQSRLLWLFRGAEGILPKAREVQVVDTAGSEVEIAVDLGKTLDPNAVSISGAVHAVEPPTLFELRFIIAEVTCHLTHQLSSPRMTGHDEIVDSEPGGVTLISGGFTLIRRRGRGGLPLLDRNLLENVLQILSTPLTGSQVTQPKTAAAKVLVTKPRGDQDNVLLGVSDAFPQAGDFVLVRSKNILYLADAPPVQPENHV